MKRLAAVGVAGLLLAMSAGAGAAPGNRKKDPPKKDEKKAEKKEDAAAAAPAPARPKTPFDEAVDFFQAHEQSGWDSGACSEAVSRFDTAGKGKIAQAYFNAGVVYERCGDYGAAEKMYNKALGINPNHGPSLANLGSIRWRQGKQGDAQGLWDKANAADAQIFEVSAVKNNMAYLKYQQMRQATDLKQKQQLEQDALHLIQGALAIDADSVFSYTLMAMIYMEGYERNRNRLEVAQLLLDTGAAKNDRYAPLHNAMGLLKMKKQNVAKALEDFKAAVQLDPKLFEARMNWGLIVLGSRNYDEAEQQFREALKLKKDSYTAMVGLGVALRGQATVLRSAGNQADFAKKIDEAEETYNAALKINNKPGDAYFNLGLLYLDYRTLSEDLNKNIEGYNKAKNYFEEFKTHATKDDPKFAEAEQQSKKCDKYVEQLRKAIATQKAAQNAPAPSPPKN